MFFGYHVIEDRLIRIEGKIESLAETLRFGFSRIMSQLDDVLSQIDEATTEIATNLEADAKAIADLRTQLANAPTVTQAVLDRLTATSTRLAASAARAKEIGADPAAPVPALTPTTTPPATV